MRISSVKHTVAVLWLLHSRGIGGRADEFATSPLADRWHASSLIPFAGLNPADQSNAGKELVVRLGRVPYATHLKFQPLTSDFVDISGHLDAFLTKALPLQFVTLSPGQILKLRHDGEDYQLLVTEVKPAAEAVLVINTNVAVSFDQPQEDASGSRRRAQLLTGPGQPITGVAAAAAISSASSAATSSSLSAPLAPATTHYAHYWFSIPPDVDLSAEDVVVTVKPEQTSGHEAGQSAQSGVDVFVDIGNKRPRLTQHLWSVTAPDGGSVSLRDENVTFQDDAAQPANLMSAASSSSMAVDGAGDRGAAEAAPTVSRFFPNAGTLRTFYVSVRASSPRDTPFTLQYELVPRKPAEQHSPASTSAASSSQQQHQSPDSKQCPNCMAYVPTAAFAMHSAVCARNNVRCTHPGCGAMLRKGSKEASDHAHCTVPGCTTIAPPAHLPKHHSIFHSELNCEEGCGAKLELREMHRHVKNECPWRFIVCRFCGDRVRAGGVAGDHYDRVRGHTAHEADCGSRTRVCNHCKPKRAVMYKQWDDHLKVLHPELAAAAAAQQQHGAASAPTGGGGDSVVTGGTDVDGAVDVNANATEWSCPSCTFANENTNTVCEMCATARPPGFGPPKAKASPTTSPTPVTEAGASTGAASSSSARGTPMPTSMGALPAPGATDELQLGRADSDILNSGSGLGGYGSSSGGYQAGVGQDYEGYSGGGAGGHDNNPYGRFGARGFSSSSQHRVGSHFSGSGEGFSLASRPCSNETCGSRVNPSADAVEAYQRRGLCNRCQGMIIEEPQHHQLREAIGAHSGSDDVAMVDDDGHSIDWRKVEAYLRDRYSVQMEAGCQYKGCKNQYCRTGRGVLGLTRLLPESISAQTEALVQQAMKANKFNVCVDTNIRFVPTTTVGIAAAAAAGISAGPLGSMAATSANGWKVNSVTSSPSFGPSTSSSMATSAAFPSLGPSAAGASAGSSSSAPGSRADSPSNSTATAGSIGTASLLAAGRLGSTAAGATRGGRGGLGKKDVTSRVSGAFFP